MHGNRNKLIYANNFPTFKTAHEELWGILLDKDKAQAVMIKIISHY